jgi:XTP/dITP diphosphohydrolase
MMVILMIYFVTSNRNKHKEVEEILKRGVKRVSLDIDEIQDIELDKIIRGKAKSAYEIIKKPVLVEDTALHILALNSFPGALIKWVLKTIGNEGICDLMKGKKERGVVAKTYFCFYDGKVYRIFTGEVKGTIPQKPLGKSGFGWDPVFVPEGFKKSFAQLSSRVKNKISMRGLALDKLKNFLDNI